jgi:hypothetical protein
LSDSRRELAAVTPSPQLSGERLAELLSAISEAPDFATAATYLLAQFADIVGADRAIALTLDSPPTCFISVASIGFERATTPQLELSVDDLSNPLVVSALSLQAVSCEEATPARGLPFSEWTAIPFPQPQYRGAPHILSDAEIDAVQLERCQVRKNIVAERRRRLGHAPGGVVLIEASVDERATGCA